MNDTPGVKLTSVTINAASPDVIGALLKEITDKVLAAIPPDTVEAIASDVIRGGAVVYKRYAYGSTTSETFRLSDEASALTVTKTKAIIEKAVEDHLAKATTQAVIAQLVEVGIAAALAEAPKVAARAVATRMANAYIGDLDEHQIANQMTIDRERINRLVETLFQRGVINTPV